MSGAKCPEFLLMFVFLFAIQNHKENFVNRAIYPTEFTSLKSKF